jgi:hypothetical protein
MFATQRRGLKPLGRPEHFHFETLNDHKRSAFAVQSLSLFSTLRYSLANLHSLKSVEKSPNAGYFPRVHLLIRRLDFSNDRCATRRAAREVEACDLAGSGCMNHGTGSDKPATRRRVIVREQCSPSRDERPFDHEQFVSRGSGRKQLTITDPSDVDSDHHSSSNVVDITQITMMDLFLNYGRSAGMIGDGRERDCPQNRAYRRFATGFHSERPRTRIIINLRRKILSCFASTDMSFKW